MRSPIARTCMLPLGCIFTLFAKLTDFGRSGVAGRFQLFTFGNTLAPFAVECLECINVQRKTARGQTVPDLFKIITEEVEIVHEPGEEPSSTNGLRSTPISGPLAHRYIPLWAESNDYCGTAPGRALSTPTSG